MFKKLFPLAAILVVFGTLAFSAVASASPLYDVVPGGLPTNNAGAALAKFKSRANVDPSIQAVITKGTDASSYNSADYQADGYSHGAPADTENSGITASGGVAPTADTSNCNIHAVMLVVVNIKTNVKFYVCTRCSNPRIYTTPQTPKPVFHPFSKGTVVKYRKTAKKTVKICGIKETIKVTITGKLSARTWGKVTGELNARLSAAFHAKIRIAINAKCPAKPRPKPKPKHKHKPAPKPTISCPAGSSLIGNTCVSQTQSCPTGSSWNGSQCVQQVVSCPAGSTMNSNGNCVAQSNSAEQNCEAQGGSWNGNTNLCTITEVNGTCSIIYVINGSGDTVSTTNTGVCNTTPTPSPPTIVITSFAQVNMINAGEPSGQECITVNASQAGGSVTIDPSIGSVSDTTDQVQQPGLLVSNLPAGSSPVCFILWAPNDSDMPTSMMYTATATLANATPAVETSLPITISYATRT